jgi:integrase
VGVSERGTGRPGCHHTHSFRKTVATLIDDEGLSARIGADHLGHTHVSMTQDRYMTRGRIHTQVADLLDRTVRITDENDDSRWMILKNRL